MRLLLTSVLLFGVASCLAAEDGTSGKGGLPSGNGATTVQLPTFGISFNADGVLQTQTSTDPTGKLTRQRAAAARAALPANLLRSSASRKVSLVRLERAIAEQIQKGQRPTGPMLKLAGLTSVAAIYCYPGHSDIVIEGPAEPWMDDLLGRPIGMTSHKPTLLLEDLAVALRAYAPSTRHHGFVGCTINPTREGLQRLQAFQKTIPRSISMQQRVAYTPRIARGVQESLGSAKVQVFGISEKTHFARVMIEADYRMKRIALGLEPVPVRKMTSYAAAMKSARNGALQRWWFTPAYEGVRTAPSRLAMNLTGQGVQLQTEDKTILPTGVLVASGRKPGKPMLTFANSFTRHYEEVAAVDVTYAQLRQLVDLLIVAAFMRQHDWYGQASWSADCLLDEALLPVETFANPQTAPVVVNTFWKGNRLFTPAGGGVSIEAEHALTTELLTEDDELTKHRAALEPEWKDGLWWWD